MGNSQPTVTEQIAAFQRAHADFRHWLKPREQQAFDRLVNRLYHYHPALNMTEDLDFYRRVLLVAYLDLAADLEERSAAQRAEIESQVKLLQSMQARLALVTAR